MMRWIGLLALALVATGCDKSEDLKNGTPNESYTDSGLSVDAGLSDAGWGGGQGGAGGQGVGGQGAGGMGGNVPTGNTNISLGGAQDLGYFRRLLDDNIVPTREDFSAAGFFAEHHTPLPEPDCGERVCAQAMIGVLGNLINGNNCTMLQIGLNSPLVADPGLRPPLSLVVVVDVSGSMRADGKLDFVRQGLNQMIDALNDEDTLAVIKYSNEASILQSMQPIRGNRAGLRALINSLVPETGTNLHAGLQAGFEEAFANYDSGHQNRVLLLSDGQATVGITDDERILAMSRGFNREGVGLTTVGLGTNFNFPLMQGLAEQGDGNFYFVEDASAVEEVFSEELSYFTVPVAFDLELQLSAGSDYRFLRSVGSSQFKTNATGGNLSVPSVFLAHRESHADVTPGGGRRGGGSALLVELMPIENPARVEGDARVADIEVSFREPGTNRIVEQTVEVRYPELPWVVRNQGFFDNAIVEKSFVMLNIYVAMEMAVDAFHFERDATAAITVLQRLIAAVADYADSANEGGGDRDMDADIELMQQLINVIVANGGIPPEDPEINEDPWPCD